MDIIYTPHFARLYKKLPMEVKLSAEKMEKIFRKDPFDSRLATHKLHGRFKSLWAFSINKQCRIIFEFNKDTRVYFHAVGDHDIYDF